MTTSRQTGCGCTVKPKQPYIEQECKLIPEYNPGCHECGGKNTYSKKECVYVCRDGVMDIYSSLEDDNEDEPVKGSRKDKPTWVFRNTCDAFTPAPVVEGAGVTSKVNDETGQVTYTITQGVDTDTDTVCETTIKQTDAGLVFSKVCKDIITDEEISNVELYTIPTAAMDLFGKLEPDTDNPGQLVWTPAGDGDSQCVYDCGYIDTLKCELKGKLIDGNPKVFSSIFRKDGAGSNNATVVATEITSESLVETITLKKADFCPDGECSYNGILLDIRMKNSINDINTDDGIDVGIVSKFEIVGGNTFVEGIGGTQAVEPENDLDKNNKDKDREILWDADDCIVINHYVLASPDPAIVEDVISEMVVRAIKCVTTC